VAPKVNVLNLVRSHTAPVIAALQAENTELQRRLFCAKYPGTHQVPNPNGTTSLGCNGCFSIVETTPGHDWLACHVTWRNRLSALQTERDSLAAAIEQMKADEEDRRLEAMEEYDT
jgi:hypothetical protein